MSHFSLIYVSLLATGEYVTIYSYKHSSTTLCDLEIYYYLYRHKRSRELKLTTVRDPPH
jgi:hypothetical protein